MPFRAGKIDALLVLMVAIWGVNYSLIKRAFEDIPPQPFNALRLLIASAVYYAAIRIARRRARTAGGGPVSSIFYTPHPLTTRDRVDLLWLGLVGHTAYQFCFVGGVALTSVSNAALIIGATPVVIAVVSAALGRDRIGPMHWTGAAVSVAGLYLVIGHGASFGGTTLSGDVLIMVSIFCWAAYTIGAGRLMTRHSPLYVTGMTMMVGGVPYVLIAVPQMLGVDWAGLDAGIWVSLVVSALFALNLAYLIWYIGVQRIGPTRTSTYSNVVPIAAMAVAAVWLDEPLPPIKLAGAAAVLGGVLLTRLGRRPAPEIPVEKEEP